MSPTEKNEQRRVRNMNKIGGKTSYSVYFIVAILSLIAFLVRHSTIWLVLCFAWLSMGFSVLARDKKNHH